MGPVPITQVPAPPGYWERCARKNLRIEVIERIVDQRLRDAGLVADERPEQWRDPLPSEIGGGG